MKTRIELEKMVEEARKIVREKFPEVDVQLVTDLLQIQADNLQSTAHATQLALQQRISKESEA